MDDRWLQGTLGHTGLSVCRLGLAATYRPGERTVERALDEGMNYMFCFGLDGQMIRVLRRLPASRRERIVIGPGAYNYLWWWQDLVKALEKRLRRLRTDYKELLENLAAARSGPLADDALTFLRAYGDVVHRHAGWFM